MRIAILYGAAIISRALAGVLSYTMQKMNGVCGLKSWQWMFLIEGSPIIPLSMITYLFLDSVPNAVQWLTNIEKQLLTNLLRDDVGLVDYNPASSTELSWREVHYVFVDWKVYLYAFTTVGNLIYRDVDKPTYQRGHAICGGMIAASLILTIILRICLMRENRRRTNLSPEEYQHEASVDESINWHLDVRYVL
ncbi:unnamed protein product [Rotaria sp. Silwood1]|nr:unnamed protein product [Rotaria sp. Silwood1]